MPACTIFLGLARMTLALAFALPWTLVWAGGFFRASALPTVLRQTSAATQSVKKCRFMKASGEESNHHQPVPANSYQFPVDSLTINQRLPALTRSSVLRLETDRAFAL